MTSIFFNIPKPKVTDKGPYLTHTKWQLLYTDLQIPTMDTIYLIILILQHFKLLCSFVHQSHCQIYRACQRHGTLIVNSKHYNAKIRVSNPQFWLWTQFDSSLSQVTDRKRASFETSSVNQPMGMNFQYIELQLLHKLTKMKPLVSELECCLWNMKWHWKYLTVSATNCNEAVISYGYLYIKKTI